MSARNMTLRALLGLLLGLGLGSAEGCQPNDGEAFLDEAAQLMCDFNERCPGVFQQPGRSDNDFPAGEACVDGILAYYQPCTDCVFDETNARRCLRRMQRGLDRCSFENIPMAVCDSVFTCDDSQAECTIRDPSQCSVSSQPRHALAVLGGLLLMLGWSTRRRIT